jgi:hypothetical protein
MSNTPPRQGIPDDVLAQVMSDHETRLNALAAQQVHLAIMVEHLVNLLTEAVPDFEIDHEEFNEFRNKKFEEIKNEAMDLQEARRKATAAARAIRNGEEPLDVDLDEVENQGQQNG